MFRLTSRLFQLDNTRECSIAVEPRYYVLMELVFIKFALVLQTCSESSGWLIKLEIGNIGIRSRVPTALRRTLTHAVIIITSYSAASRQLSSYWKPFNDINELYSTETNQYPIRSIPCLLFVFLSNADKAFNDWFTRQHPQTPISVAKAHVTRARLARALNHQRPVMCP